MRDVIVVANVKGGVGKTTTAVYLAAAATQNSPPGPVWLVDADPQASAAEWLEESPVPGVRVAEAPSERLLARAADRGANGDTGLVIIDTPPGNERLVRAGLSAAQVVIVPTRVGGVEPTRAQATLGMLPSGLPVGLVVCAARSGTRDLRDTRAAWREVGVPIWATIPQRVGIAAGPDAEGLHPGGLDAYGPVLTAACDAAKVGAPQ